MNKYNLAYESQSGFRQTYRYQAALIKLIDQWMAVIDKAKTIGSFFIDFPIGILGQVWYLIVSIPDLCTLTYF